MNREIPPVVAILGFGMAGRPFARGLAEAGVAQVRVWKRRPWGPEHTGAAAHTAIFLTDAIEAAVGGASIVLSLLTAEAAVGAARAAAPHLGGTVFADLNTTTPEQMTEIGRIVEAAGGHPVDGAICDPVEIHGHRAATLVSGPRAEELAATLAPFGMRLKPLSGRAGDASALKMIRSVFTKSLMATFVETLEAARRCDVVEPVLDSLAATCEGLSFRELALSLGGTSLVAAERRAAEMEKVVEILRTWGMDAGVSAAALEKFRRLARLGTRDRLGGLPPRSIEEMLDALEGATGRNGSPAAAKKSPGSA